MSLIPAFEIGVWNAWLFMSVFILQMLAVILMGRKAWQRSSIPADFKRSGLERSAPVIGNSIWALATLYSIFLPLKLMTNWFYSGLAVFIIGLAILVIATVNFGSAPDGKPATKGMYRLSRHPLYLSSFIIYLATSIATASWLFFVLGIINGIWIAIEVSAEERYCLKKYGDVYREYMDRTPRWLGLPPAV
jgi:protein-S-isoprenylcysteine O-methyltransferase Ste14